MKVVICTPTIVKPHPAYLAALEASIPALDASGHDHSLVAETGNPYISAARAKMLRKALDAQADAVIFIDHDVSWRPQDLISLIETPGEVVAGLYRFKSDEISFMGTIYTDPAGFPAAREDACIRAKLVPAGFLKITTDAVERFMTAYPDLCYGPKYSPSVDLFNHGARDGLWWGEDYAFSKRFGEAGGELWVQPDLNLTHHSADAEYPGNFHEFLTRQAGGANDPQRAPITQSAA
jgi:hypothetical protein